VGWSREAGSGGKAEGGTLQRDTAHCPSSSFIAASACGRPAMLLLLPLLSKAPRDGMGRRERGAHSACAPRCMVCAHLTSFISHVC